MKNELESRTLKFAVDVVRFAMTLPRSIGGEVIGRQLLKSGTSIGANYREANRAVSKPEFISKVGIAEKEAAETDYWLELCERLDLGPAPIRTQLSTESRELLAILTAIGRNAKRSPVHQA